jgi:hypothetical protein
MMSERVEKRAGEARRFKPETVGFGDKKDDDLLEKCGISKLCSL